jgi:hypothetical protein
MATRFSESELQMKIQRTVPEIDKDTTVSIKTIEKLTTMYTLLKDVSEILVSIPVNEHIRSMESDLVAQALESIELSMSIRTCIGLN